MGFVGAVIASGPTSTCLGGRGRTVSNVVHVMEGNEYPSKIRDDLRLLRGLPKNVQWYLAPMAELVVARLKQPGYSCI